MNRIEADKKFTTGEVILKSKLSSLKVDEVDVTLKLKFLKVSHDLSLWPLHLRHISLTKSVCTPVSMFQSTELLLGYSVFHVAGEWPKIMLPSDTVT